MTRFIGLDNFAILLDTETFQHGDLAELLLRRHGGAR